MKLKKAIKIARQHGCNWIAVDRGGEIYGYVYQPRHRPLCTLWAAPSDDFVLIGKYTGKKHWTDTLREVK